VNPTIFRKVSLERLSSPEQLDQLMQVTDPRGWLISAPSPPSWSRRAWGSSAAFPRPSPAWACSCKSGGVFEVIALSGGRISDVAVSVGDEVTEGQVVARLSQPELSDRLREAKAVLASLRANRRRRSPTAARTWPSRPSSSPSSA
jgi:HlyD family secretion protein